MANTTEKIVGLVPVAIAAGVLAQSTDALFSKKKKKKKMSFF